MSATEHMRKIVEDERRDLGKGSALKRAAMEAAERAARKDGK
jgi:hypothetical protein